MMDKSFIGHAVFAGVAAVAAYFAWASPTAVATGDSVVVIPGSPERLGSVEWQDDRYNITVRRRDEDVTVTVKTLPKTASTEAASVEAEPVARQYPGSERARQLFDNLAPLEAARSLGAIEADKMESLGLTQPSGKLVLRYGETEHVVEVGSSTFGSGDRYARLADSGEVFLLRSSTILGLRHGASSLLDRRAVGVAVEKIERVTIRSGVQSRELVQRHAEERDKSFFADRAVPDTKLEQSSNWIDRIVKLRIADITDRKPVGEPRLVVELHNGESTLGTLSLWAPDDKIALATSTRFASPVAISKANAEAILRDVDAVLQEGR